MIYQVKRLTNKLGQVHVPEDLHNDEGLRIAWVGPLRSAESPQDRKNVAQSEVIVHLVPEKYFSQVT